MIGQIFQVGYQLIIPMMFILGLALFVSASFKLSFEKSLPIGILVSILVTFIFGFIDLRIGLFISCAMAILSIPITLIRTKQNEYTIGTSFFNVYLLSFIILYIFVFVINAGKVFDRWDEYSHWGLMAKEMYRLNKYYYVKESVLTAHPEYPPFGQIWQYIWCKLIGVFKESNLYNAKLTFCLSILLSALARVIDINEKPKKIFEKALDVALLCVIVVLIAALPRLNDGSMFRTIYAEGTMIVLTVFTVILSLFVCTKSRYDIIIYGLSVASLVLVKQIGILFASISILILVIRRIIICRGMNKSTDEDIIKETHSFNSSNIGMIITGMASAIIPWFIWNRVTNYNTEAGQFDSSRFSISEMMSIMQGRGTQAQQQCIIDFTSSLFTWKLTWITGMGYVALTIVMTIVLVVICITRMRINGSIYHNQDCLWRRNMAGAGDKDEYVFAAMVALPITSIGYAIVMQVMYLFGFSEIEMAGLACYTRYMNSLMGMWGIVVIVIGISYYSDYVKGCLDYKIGILVSLILIMFIGISGFKYEFTPGMLTHNNEGAFIRDAENIDKYTDEGSSIYLISSYGNDSHSNIIRFLTKGKYISDMYISPKISDFDNVVRYMSEFDYVYLYGIDDEFSYYYGKVFPKEQIIADRQLYRIDTTEEELKLSYIDMEDNSYE